MSYCNLFRPIKLSGLELKNRVIFPAIATKMVNKDGTPSKNLINYHLRRVKGGSGLNILESTSVYGPSAPKDFLKITEDSSIDKYKYMTDLIHDAGGKIAIQLWEGGIFDEEDLDRKVIVPSKYTTKNSRAINAATIDEIEEVIKSFAKAANRAYRSGFDAIEVNIGHNDSTHMFLSKEFNKRKDSYGGDLENRLSYPSKILKAIRDNIPKEMPLLLKIVSKDEGFKLGLTEEEIIKSIIHFEKIGVDLVSIYRGNPLNDSKKYELPTSDMDNDYSLDFIHQLKKKVKLPIATGTGITRPEKAEEILSNKDIDLVYIGRGFLSDPYIIKKAMESREDDIIECISCNQGCYDTFNDILYPTITCLRNPAIGKEKDFKIVATEDPKKIAIIGGGISGILAAKLLKQRGHDPVIYEQEKVLGGNYNLASMGVGKDKFKKLLLDNIEKLKTLNVSVNLNTKFNEDIILKEEFDKVVIASGSSPKPLDIKGNDKENVYYAVDYLKEELKLSGNIIIIGSDRVALETAEILSKDNKVTVVEETNEIGKDLGDIRKIVILDKLKEQKVKILSGLKLVEINNDGLKVETSKGNKILKGDYILVSNGFTSNKCNDIKQFCQDREIPFYVIGDALIPRSALEAVGEAVNIGLFEIE